MRSCVYMLALLLLAGEAQAAERASLDYLEIHAGSYSGVDYADRFSGETAGVAGNIDLGAWRVLHFSAEKVEAEHDTDPGIIARGEHFALGIMMDAAISAHTDLLVEIGVQHDWWNVGTEADVAAGIGSEASNSVYGALDYRMMWGSVVEFGLRGEGRMVLHQRRRVLSSQLLFHFSEGFSAGLRYEQWRRGEKEYEESETRALASLRWTF